MGLIYSSASKVSIWLGPENKIYSRVPTFIQDMTCGGPHGRRYKNSGVNFMRDLKALFAHPYWSQAWIAQECIFATELELRCGPYRLTDEVLDRLKSFRSQSKGIDVYLVDLGPPVVDQLSQYLKLTKKEQVECYSVALRHTPTCTTRIYALVIW